MASPESKHVFVFYSVYGFVFATFFYDE